MRMALSYGMGLRQRLEQRPEHRLEHRQQQKLLQGLSPKLLEIRIQMVESLHPGGVFKPTGGCPRCGYEMEVGEILKGFSDDPYDTLTSCPKCTHRFQPRMRASNTFGSIELPFFCERQTERRLNDIGMIPFEMLEKDHPAVVKSARFYWGSITAGFKRFGKKYEGEPPMLWKERLKPFLGKVPDTLIANVAGVAKSTVQAFRTSLKIAPYSKSANK